MGATPVTSNGNNVQQLTDYVKTQNNGKNNNNNNSKAINNETVASDTLSISDEAMYLSMLTEGVANGDRAAHVSQSSVRTMEYGIKLMQTMKDLRLEGLGSGNDVIDLAKAYDIMQGKLNENSVNSQKHVKFLNDAFKDLARFYFVNNASQDFAAGAANTDAEITDDVVPPPAGDGETTGPVVDNNVIDDNANDNIDNIDENEITDNILPPVAYEDETSDAAIGDVIDENDADAGDEIAASIIPDAVNNKEISLLKQHQAISEAETKAAIFADAFLSNYKKLGMDGALEAALKAINSNTAPPEVSKVGDDDIVNEVLESLPESEDTYQIEPETIYETEHIDVYA